MPRFFFHSWGGIDARDEEGLDLPDLDAARREAIRSVRSVAAEQVAEGHLHLSERIDIATASGRVLATITMADAVDIGQ